MTIAMPWSVRKRAAEKFIGRLPRAIAYPLILVVSVLLWSAIAFMVLSLILGSARADTWISSTVASHHEDRMRGYNERNWGLGIEYEVHRDIRLIGGFYKNSFYDQSKYAGVTYAPFAFLSARFGIVAGAVDGYPMNGGHFFPMLAPLITFEHRGMGLNIIALPSLGKHTGVFGFQVKFKAF